MLVDGIERRLVRSKAWQKGVVSAAGDSESPVWGAPGCRCESPVIGFRISFSYDTESKRRTQIHSNVTVSDHCNVNGCYMRDLEESWLEIVDSKDNSLTSFPPLKSTQPLIPPRNLHLLFRLFALCSRSPLLHFSR